MGTGDYLPEDEVRAEDVYDPTVPTEDEEDEECIGMYGNEEGMYPLDDEYPPDAAPEADPYLCEEEELMGFESDVDFAYEEGLLEGHIISEALDGNDGPIDVGSVLAELQQQHQQHEAVTNPEIESEAPCPAAGPDGRGFRGCHAERDHAG